MPVHQQLSSAPEPMAIQRILCLGRSFTGTYLSREFPVEVRFLSRDTTDFDSNFEPDMILDTVPSVQEGDQILNPLYRTATDHLEIPYIHVSSTSVYPASTHGILEVDEASASGTTDKCLRRLRVEEAVLQHRPEALILRSGGLYGPGRSLPHFLASGKSRFFERGNEIISRIHVHDLCRIILAAAAKMQASEDHFPGFNRKRLINGVDPNPSSVEETRQYLEQFYTLPEIRKALEKQGLAAPESLPLPPDVPGQRKVCSRYTEQLIGRFRFPDFKSGFMDSMLRPSQP